MAVPNESAHVMQCAVNNGGVTRTLRDHFRLPSYSVNSINSVNLREELNRGLVKAYLECGRLSSAGSELIRYVF